MSESSPLTAFCGSLFSLFLPCLNASGDVSAEHLAAWLSGKSMGFEGEQAWTCNVTWAAV